MSLAVHSYEVMYVHEHRCMGTNMGRRRLRIFIGLRDIVFIKNDDYTDFPCQLQLPLSTWMQRAGGDEGKLLHGLAGSAGLDVSTS